HNNLGGALADLGRRNDALRWYHRALALDPDFGAAHYNLASSLAEQGDIDEAIKHYERAIQLKEGAAAYYNLGLFLGARNQLDKAIEYGREGVRINPDVPLAHYNLGTLLAEKTSCRMNRPGTTGRPWNSNQISPRHTTTSAASSRI